MSPQRSRPPRPDPDRLRVSPLDAEARAALDALVGAFVNLELPVAATAAILEVPLDIAAAQYRGTAAVAEKITGLARMLVHHTLASPRAPRAAELRAAREALEAEVEDEGPGEFDEELREVALENTDDLLREIGLEELDLDIHLATDREGNLVLACFSVPPETAHVWLLSRLYPRVELTLWFDPLLRLERRASRWWFERWSSAASRSEEWRFTWGVREQEYSLVERETLALEVPILTAFRNQPFFDEMPPRQRHLVEALDDSFASVFTVQERDGARLVLRDEVDGQRYAVHEHNAALDYRPGFLALGSVFPFAEERYLRSPGMAFVKTTRPDLARTLAEGLDKAGGIGVGVALETYLAMVQHRIRVPRRVLPADSPREAKEVLESFRGAMEKRGLLETVPATEVPDEMREQMVGRDSLEFFRMPTDEPVAEWMRALTEQARAAKQEGRRAKQKKQQKKTKSKKRKH